MEESPAPNLEPDAEFTNPEPAPRSALRRHFVKALAGTTLGGVLGYAGYPWIAGDKQQELIAQARRLMHHLREGARPSRPPEQPPETVPVHLDAHGKDYETYLASLSLRHIKPMEMLRPHFKTRGEVCNELPPRELWLNIASTLRVADELRERLGVRLLTIASAYRCPAYNAACPGAAAHSYHLQNMALDLIFECAPEKVASAAESLRASGFFSGGIGRYPTFTHIDTRGRTADWG